MISKVEIVNLDNRYFDFFTLFSKTEVIKTPSYILSIKELISSIILLNIINVDIEENKILLTIELKIKIVCTTQDDNLHMIDDRFLFFRKIEISKKIEGNDIESIFREQRLEYEILIIKKQITILSNEKILLDIQGIIGINYKRGFSIAMLMKTSEIEKNIYICFENGKDIRQITFEADTEYSLVKWVKGKNLISYVKKSFDEDYLCFYNIAENSEYEILNFTNKIYEYLFINSKKIVIDCIVNGERGVYIYDLQSEKFYKMIKNLRNIEIEKLFFREDINRIFFIKKEKEIFKLCSIKSDTTEFEEICKLSTENFFTKDNFDFIISFDFEYILLYDFENKKQIRVKYPFGNLSNLKFNSISDKKNTFAIAMDSGKEILFYIFEKKTKSFKLIKCTKKITKIGDMVFDDKGKGLFISIEVLGMYNLYRLDLSGCLTEVLALYSEELKIFKR